jgi:ParB family transcriptional regulator, chromosome partitioning protein
MTKHITLTPDLLKTHPRNMRRFYNQAGLRELADSIKQLGVLQPLVVTPNGDGKSYYVICGNRRARAAQMLGADAPPVPCTVATDASEIDQLLMMAVENGQREDVDPISEAIHFKALRDEGLSLNKIAIRTGKPHHQIAARLRLLELDAEIQDLVAQGELPRDVRLVAALMQIEDSAARIAVAKKVAADGASLTAIEGVCRRVAEQLAKQRIEQVLPHKTMLRNAQDKARRSAPSATAPAEWPVVETAARKMCESCQTVADKAVRVSAPAWRAIERASERTCQACGMHDLPDVCKACPGVTLMANLIKSLRIEEASNAA